MAKIPQKSQFLPFFCTTNQLIAYLCTYQMKLLAEFVFIDNRKGVIEINFFP